MQNKWLLCLLFCLGLFINSPVFAAWFAKATPQPQINSAQILDKRFAAQPFNSIDINGPIGVQINAGVTSPSLELIGDAASLSQVYAAVRSGVLYLGLKSGASEENVGKLLVKVYVPQLTALRYSGSGGVAAAKLSGPLSVSTGGSGNVLLLGDNIDLRDLNITGASHVHILGIASHLLNVNYNGSGNVNLSGKMVLQNLNYKGNGIFSAQWIDSSHVNVSGQGRGQIFLAGIAGQLNATISDDLFLNARYLHAQSGIINTSSQARADVWTKNNLTALATGQSNIYYYHDPRFNGGYMRTQGAVLRMVGTN